MAHEHSILDIYNAKTTSADGTVNIHNVPTKAWLGKEYASDTVLPGATQTTSVHANQAGEMVIDGFGLDGNLEPGFTATQNAYDTSNPGEMLIKHNGPSRLDEQTKLYMGHNFGGDPTLDPYIDRDYVDGAPGLE